MPQARPILVPESVKVSRNIVTLPLCDLHYIETGSGPPLIIVPASMSEAWHWEGLTAFMGQRFRAFFFELPGHGKSTPLEHYSSKLMAQVITDFLDHLGFERVSLMGFSFGGILTLTALERISHRVDRVILISPLLDSSALRIAPLNQRFLRALIQLSQGPRLQHVIHRSLQSDAGSAFWAQLAVRVGNAEHPKILKQNIRATPWQTVQTLAVQLDEIFHTHHFLHSARYTQPCWFAMSVIDPLLDFSFTAAAVRQIFSSVDETQLDLPYHRPPELPSLEYLNHTFPHLLDRIS
ncbi:MAG: alpha/beta fold hydrolase [Anaerolineae bacterium]|jgi:pimeloyl-ACP methyl ester carboxylesterase